MHPASHLTLLSGLHGTPSRDRHDDMHHAGTQELITTTPWAHVFMVWDEGREQEAYRTLTWSIF